MGMSFTWLNDMYKYPTCDHLFGPNPGLVARNWPTCFKCLPGLVLAILSKEVWAVLHVSHTLERRLIIHRHPDIIVGHFGCLLLDLVLTAYEDVELPINLVLLDTILTLRALMLVKKGETAVLPTFDNISVLVFLHEFVRFLLKILVHTVVCSGIYVWYVCVCVCGQWEKGREKG
jgi:hypothetical protein